jgi:hypothetical protein
MWKGGEGELAIALDREWVAKHGCQPSDSSGEGGDPIWCPCGARTLDFAMYYDNAPDLVVVACPNCERYVSSLDGAALDAIIENGESFRSEVYFAALTDISPEA